MTVRQYNNITLSFNGPMPFCGRRTRPQVINFSAQSIVYMMRQMLSYWIRPGFVVAVLNILKGLLK
jgi:hypothetical protein